MVQARWHPWFGSMKSLGGLALRVGPVPAGPIEWIPGHSRVPWMVGFLGVMIATLIAADLALVQGLLWGGVTAIGPNLGLVVSFASIGIAAGPGLAYGLVFPIPASRLGLSQTGVTIDHGLRSDSWPWSRTALRGDRLEVFSSWLGVPSRFRLTSVQATRVATLRQVFA